MKFNLQWEQFKSLGANVSLYVKNKPNIYGNFKLNTKL